MADASYSTNPLAWEVRPGQTVGSLTTAEACDEAALYLDAQTDKMMGQIARAESGEHERPPGWRSRVQAALRWTARVKKAVNTRGSEMRIAENKSQGQRRKAMLKVIAEEVGEEEFARFAKLTEAKHPHLFIEKTTLTLVQPTFESAAPSVDK